MKGKLFGLMAIAAWLNVSPASAITYYDYHVDFTISPNRGGPRSKSLALSNELRRLCAQFGELCDIVVVERE